MNHVYRPVQPKPLIATSTVYTNGPQGLVSSLVSSISGLITGISGLISTLSGLARTGGGGVGRLAGPAFPEGLFLLALMATGFGILTRVVHFRLSRAD